MSAATSAKLLSRSTIRTAIAEDDAKRKARAAAKRAERKAAKVAALAEPQAAAAESQAPTATPADAAAEDAQAKFAAAEERHAKEHQDYLAALRVDAEALGRDPEEYIREQLAPVKSEEGYNGPMLRLRERRLAGAYVKAANGQPCCADRVANALGVFSPARVIETCLYALMSAGLVAGNTYLGLNIGQQSMNLRNKLRGALRKGTLTDAQFDAAVAATHKAIADKLDADKLAADKLAAEQATKAGQAAA